MAHRDAFARALLSLFRTEIREFLLEHKVAGIEALDRSAELLEGALAQSGDVKLGFVGESQVGKSTLINALLDRIALPSGGIGPLTAQATRISYAPENSFAAIYHSKGQVHRHAFAIARYLERRGDLRSTDTADPPLTEEPEGDGEVPSIATTAAAVEESEALVDASADASTVAPSASKGGGNDIGQYMLDQAKRILCYKNPDLEAPSVPSGTLLDGMRAIIDQKPLGDPGALVPLERRIAEARALLGVSEEITESSTGGASAFGRALQQRAAGWMSPLVSKLRLQLNAPVLAGLSLVDLPGIGVLNDPAGQEAERFVRTEGDTLVVVFRNSGVTENIAELLERTGVITKLLFGGRDDVAPIQLVIAVTHLDDVARDRYRSARQEAGDNGEPPPDRHALFRALSEEMTDRLREMIGDALRRSQAFDDLKDDQRQSRERVVEALCRSMKIVCVAAPDYLSLTLGLEDAEFLRDREATGVPELRRHLMDLVNETEKRRSAAIVQFERALRQAIRDHLAAIAHLYQEGRGPAVQGWERFRDALTKAAEPLRQEMAAYHGETVGLLRKGINAEIQLVCKDAEMAGHKKLRRLSTQGRDLHFASLKAALMRNGIWDRRGVNYPDALTLAMVDAIASQWEAKIINKVREEVRALADRDLKLVERLCEAAKAIDARIAASEQLDAQKKVLQGNSRSAVAWTKEQLEELRGAVSRSLRSAVEGPINRACTKAINAGAHIGTGAKNRILETFEEGGEAAIEKAREEAEGTLKEHYTRLLTKLEDGFLRDNHDPVQAALETLTGDEISRARRSDTQRKRHVLAKVETFGERLAEIEAEALHQQEVPAWTPVHA